MMDQMKREAAARAWFAGPTMATMGAFWQEVSGPAYCYTGPDGANLRDWVACVVAWLAWAKADAANAALVAPDPLAGVNWETPRQIAEWARHSGAVAYRDVGVAQADRDVVTRIVEFGWTDDMYDAIITHARAQLAREAAEQEAIDSRLDAHLAGQPRASTPLAPVAVTLEDATTAALAAELERRGCRVLTPSHARLLEHEHDVAWNAYEALRGLERVTTGGEVLAKDMRDALRALGMQTMPHRCATWTNPAGGL